jgi:hypothetical protein
MKHILSVTFLLRIISCLLIAAFVNATVGNGLGVVAQQESTTVRVDSTLGNDFAGCGTETAPCRSIQYALNSISAWGAGTILVAEGSYYYSGSGNDCERYLGTSAVVCIVNRNITLIGGYPHSDWSQPMSDAHPTDVDGQGQRRGVYVVNTESNTRSVWVEIQNFVIQNGVQVGKTSGSIDDLYAFGGGMMDNSAILILRNIAFKNNQVIGGSTSQSFGGAGSGGGLAMLLAPAGTYLENVTFTQNKAMGGSGSTRGGYGIGGGLYSYKSTYTGTNLTVINNQAIGGGTNGSGATPDYEKGDAQGGGISFQEESGVELSDIVVTGNVATGGNAPNGSGGGAFGGGVFAQNAEFTLHRATINMNKALGGAGKNPMTDPWFYGSLGEGGGLSADASIVTLDSVKVVGNQAIGGNGSNTGYGGAGAGGGAYLAWYYGPRNSIEIVNSIFADNYAAHGMGGAITGGGGGGLDLQGVQGTIKYSTIARNQLGSTSMQGTAIVALTGGQPVDVTFSNVIIANHTTPANLHAVRTQTGSILRMERTLWAGNWGNIYSGQGSGTVVNSNALTAASADFVSPGAPNYDYRIKKTSPAKDAGTGQAPTVDINLKSRTLFAPADIGASEYVPLVVSVSPARSGSLWISWVTDTSLVTGINHYEIIITCEAGATCPAAVNAGLSTRYALQGLTNSRTYTIRVQAWTATQAIETSNAIAAKPMAYSIFLPALLR